MRLLVTGANGFLGSELCNQLKRTDHSIIPLVRKKAESNEVECDIGNANDLLTALNTYKPDVIINCAAKVDFSENSKKEQYVVNALAPAIISSWCTNNEAYLVQVSGSIVNGDSVTQFSIDSTEFPVNYYGKTKLLADQAIELSQCKYSIIRFGGIFGEGGPNHLGINNAINQAKIGNIPTIIGKGSALRNYIHVRDAAKALIYCVDHKILGVHYAGSNQPISIAKMIEDICDIYLNNQIPNFQNGDESLDQITIVSSSLPEVRSFSDALKAYQ